MKNPITLNTPINIVIETVKNTVINITIVDKNFHNKKTYKNKNKNQEIQIYGNIKIIN